MGIINQLMGDCIKKVNPEYANRLVITRHIKREYNNKKIIICSSGSEAEGLDKQLQKMKIANGCDYFVELEEKVDKVNGKEVKSVENIMYEDTDNIYIAVIASNTTHRILGKLIEMGYTVEMLHVFCNENIPGGSQLLNVYDVNLGYTRVDDILGFTIFDHAVNQEAKVMNIVTLGGSTTDATFANVMSWSELLQNKLIERGINAKVYCGGIAAYNSTQELMKCIRDVVPMEPNLVLLYSGINDVKTPKSDTPFVLDYQSQLLEDCAEKGMLVNGKAYKNVGSDHRIILKETGYGLPNTKTIAQYWVDNIRMMHAVCSEFSIPFLAFFQPNVYISRGSSGPSFHKELLEASEAAGYKRITQEVIETVKAYEYIVDLTNIFDNKQEVYMDDCHVLEQGNEIIANNIMRYVSKTLNQ